MEKYISNTKVEITDGNYEGRWSAYSLAILSPTTGKTMCTIETINGVKGINCPIKLAIKDGYVSEY